MNLRCNWNGCGISLVYSGRGRPPEYCPEHAKASRKRTDKGRPDRRSRKQYPQCCLDAQAAKVRAYKGGARVKAANVRTCAQHQQWRAWYGRDRRGFLAERAEEIAEESNLQVVEYKLTGAFRLSMHHPDNYFIPDPPLGIEWPSPRLGWDDIPIPAVKSGYDAEVEAMTRRYLLLSPKRQAHAKSDTANEPAAPLDLGYWRDKCAERRRWHTSEAFRYPPEVNRGAGWCA